MASPEDGAAVTDQMEVDEESPDISVLSKSEGSEMANSWVLVPVLKENEQEEQDQKDQKQLEMPKQTGQTSTSTAANSHPSYRDYASGAPALRSVKSAVNDDHHDISVNETMAESQMASNRTYLWSVGSETDELNTDNSSIEDEKNKSPAGIFRNSSYEELSNGVAAQQIVELDLTDFGSRKNTTTTGGTTRSQEHMMHDAEAAETNPQIHTSDEKVYQPVSLELCVEAKTTEFAPSKLDNLVAMSEVIVNSQVASVKEHISTVMDVTDSSQHSTASASVRGALNVDELPTDSIETCSTQNSAANAQTPFRTLNGKARQGEKLLAEDSANTVEHIQTPLLQTIEPSLSHSVGVSLSMALMYDATSSGGFEMEIVESDEGVGMTSDHKQETHLPSTEYNEAPCHSTEDGNSISQQETFMKIESAGREQSNDALEFIDRPTQIHASGDSDESQSAPQIDKTSCALPEASLSDSQRVTSNNVSSIALPAAHDSEGQTVHPETFETDNGCNDQKKALEDQTRGVESAARQSPPELNMPQTAASSNDQIDVPRLKFTSKDFANVSVGASQVVAPVDYAEKSVSNMTTNAILSQHPRKGITVSPETRTFDVNDLRQAMIVEDAEETANLEKVSKERKQQIAQFTLSAEQELRLGDLKDNSLVSRIDGISRNSDATDQPHIEQSPTSITYVSPTFHRSSLYPKITSEAAASQEMDWQQTPSSQLGLQGKTSVEELLGSGRPAGGVLQAEVLQTGCTTGRHTTSGKSQMLGTTEMAPPKSSAKKRAAVVQGSLQNIEFARSTIDREKASLDMSGGDADSITVSFQVFFEPDSFELEEGDMPVLIFIGGAHNFEWFPLCIYPHPVSEDWQLGKVTLLLGRAVVRNRDYKYGVLRKGKLESIGDTDWEKFHKEPLKNRKLHIAEDFKGDFFTKLDFLMEPQRKHGRSSQKGAIKRLFARLVKQFSSLTGWKSAEEKRMSDRMDDSRYFALDSFLPKWTPTEGFVSLRPERTSVVEIADEIVTVARAFQRYLKDSTDGLQHDISQLAEHLVDKFGYISEFVGKTTLPPEVRFQAALVAQMVCCNASVTLNNFPVAAFFSHLRLTTAADNRTVENLLKKIDGSRGSPSFVYAIPVFNLLRRRQGTLLNTVLDPTDLVAAKSPVKWNEVVQILHDQKYQWPRSSDFFECVLQIFCDQLPWLQKIDKSTIMQMSPSVLMSWVLTSNIERQDSNNLQTLCTLISDLLHHDCSSTDTTDRFLGLATAFFDRIVRQLISYKLAAWNKINLLDLTKEICRAIDATMDYLKRLDKSKHELLINKSTFWLMQLEGLVGDIVVNQFTWSKEPEEEISAWDELFHVEMKMVPSDHQQRIARIFGRRLTIDPSTTYDSKVKYLAIAAERHMVMKEQCEAEVFRIVNGSFNSRNGEPLMNLVTGTKSLSFILSDVFSSRWSKSPNDDSLTRLLISSEFGVDVCLKHVARADDATITSASQSLIKSLVCVIKQTADSIEDLSVTLERLTILQDTSKRTRFVELVSLIPQATVAKLNELMDTAAGFRQARSHLRSLTDIIDVPNAAVTLLREKLIHADSDIRMSDLISDGDHDILNPPIVLQFFGLSAAWNVQLPRLELLCDSHIYRYIVKPMVVGHQPANLDALLNVALVLAVKEVKELLNLISSGAILLSQLDGIFYELSRVGPQEMIDVSFKQLCTAVDLPYEAITLPLHNYTAFRSFSCHINDAQLLLNLVQSLRLQMDQFGELQQLVTWECHHELDSKSLSEVTAGDNLEIGKFVQRLTPDRIDCIKAVIDSSSMVDWINENVKAEKELQAFVGLAEDATNEMELSVISTLNVAVSSYAPLIWLPRYSGWTQLQESLESLFKSLQSDQTITEKLLCCSKNLRRIKESWKSVGSFEKISIGEVRDINSRGSYRLGMIRESGVDLSNLVNLALPADDKAPAVWSFDELNDLYTRLTLIGGRMAKENKADVQIELFSGLFQLIVKLTDLYRQHCDSGNVFFLQFLAEIHCDRNLEVSCHISFGVKTDLIKLSGTRGPENAAQMLIEMMTTSLNEWRANLVRYRHDSPHLNFFTNRQVAMLRQDLAKSDVLQPQTAMMLMSLGCSITNETVAEARSQVDVGHVYEQDEDERQKRIKVLQCLRNYGIADSTAIYIGQLTKWDLSAALDYAFKEDSDIIATSQICDADGDTANTASRILLSQAGTPESEWEMGREQLLAGWRKYLWQQQTTTVDQFISLRHLAGILDHLSRQPDGAGGTKMLTLPGWIRRDDINVLIVATDDVIKYLLAAYQAGGAPPAHHQVLMCRQDTNVENLELFFNRMHQAIDPLLYSLAFPERLPTAMCRHLERLAEAVVQADCRATLALFCGEENFHNSPVGAMWTEGQRTLSGLAKWSEVSLFIRQLLTRRKAAENDCCESLLDAFKSVLVTSVGCGQGKSLLVRRQVDFLQERQMCDVELIKVPIYPAQIDSSLIVELMLNSYAENPEYQSRRIRVFHLDFISSYVPVDEILFELLILGCLSDGMGRIWRFLPQDSYAVELTSPPNKYLLPDLVESESPDEITTFRFTLPVALCLGPQKCAETADSFSRPGVFLRSADGVELESEPFQRCFYQLSNQPYYEGVTPLAEFTNLLNLLIKLIGISHPSWVELKHFVKFLDSQLSDYCMSDFCSSAAEEYLPGFSQFVMTFLVEMAQDFGTRSLKMSEEMAELTAQSLEQLEGYSIKRRWEERPHPYIFFNENLNRNDGHRDSFSFFGCTLDDRGNLVQKGRVVKRRFAKPELVEALIVNKVDLKEFNQLSDVDRLQKIQRVLGVPETCVSPNRNYEITGDCAVKICAIHTRLRCGIPVCIMGETGCGKTALVKFMYQLKGQGKTDNNLVVFKVHGGTTYEHIESVVLATSQLAEENWRNYKIDTGLLCDEVNSSDAMGMIKELMCDGTLRGKHQGIQAKHLQLLVAVNPYKRHTEETIAKMKCAGFIRSDNAFPTMEKIGSVPLRELVYRVRPLPVSLIPLVWDFGTLSAEVEEVYIGQIVAKFCQQNSDFGASSKPLVNILVESQSFMRAQKAECSYVSLRNVERALMVMAFLYRHRLILFKQCPMVSESDQNTNVSRAVATGIAICYQASLPDCRDDFDKHIAKCFVNPLRLPNEFNSVAHEAEQLQQVLVESLELEATVARNLALCENVLMMFMCAELRIPLFLVGKPGSSKSLAKTVVETSMRGQASQINVLKQFKQAKVFSYQCSNLSTSEGVGSIFQQCAQYQESANKDNVDLHVAVAVLDEIGLAEDSPNLPLKALHGLLEDGYNQPGENTQTHHKVGFVGISNWALDPAQLNRGIFVSRTLPTQDELLRTAIAICESGKAADSIRFLIEPLTAAYHEVYREQRWTDFYGLRDFYGLIKMIFDLASLPGRSGQRLSYADVMKAIQRNFSGNQESEVRSIFVHHLKPHMDDIDDTRLSRVAALLEENLNGFPGGQRDNRYMLVLTERLWALRLLRSSERLANSIVIFGSAFRRDCLYTQVCSNINRIKLAMENGATVVLLNLERLYESLYDLLNQSFIALGNDRFVDLGLGIHRLKCRVHKDFRLIVIANCEDVLAFPAALINRLEKHLYTALTDMSSEQKDMVDRLQRWIEYFVVSLEDSLAAADYFIGYHKDTSASLIAELTADGWSGRNEDEIILAAQKRLIQCATPEAIIKHWGQAKSETAEIIYRVYFEQQSHDGLLTLLRHKLSDYVGGCRSYEVTTHSRSLSNADREALQKSLVGVIKHIDCFQLEDYDTEAEFSIEVNNLFELTKNRNGGGNRLLVIQCLSGNNRERLLACAKYRIQEQIKEDIEANVVVLFLVTLNRGGGAKKFAASHAGMWDCHHVDDIDDFSPSTLGRLSDYREVTMSQLINNYLQNPTESAIDFRRVLKSSVHQTVALLVDYHNKSSRKTDRIGLLLASLDSDDFFTQILSRLCQLQREKELATSKAKEWFNMLARNLKMILENRTFKLATFKRLQISLMPLFAGLLSQIDVAANCDHLKGAAWQRETFLRLLNCSDLLSLHYGHESAVFFTTGTNRILRDKFPIPHPCPFDFECKFPFSWMLMERVERLMHEQRLMSLKQAQVEYGQESTPAKEEKETTVEHLLTQFEWGNLLLSLDDDQLQTYLEDLVNWSYQVTSRAEAQLIGRWLWLGIEGKSVARGHTRTRELRTRVEGFLSVVADERWSFITEGLFQNTDLLNDSQQQLDVCAVILLLETLDSTVAKCCAVTDDRYTVVRRTCVELIQGSTIHIESLLIQIGNDGVDISTLRFRWQKLMIFHQFMIHTMHVDYKFNIEGFWNLMGEWHSDADDFVTGLDKLLKVWNKLLRQKLFRIIAAVVSCRFCNKPIGNTIDPTIVSLLPCLHAVHGDCLKRMFNMNQQRCPQCQDRIPDDYARLADSNMREARKRYETVRSALSCFYVDFLQTSVFRRDKQPSDMVVKKLIDYVIHVPTGGSNGNTAMCFPVADDIAIDPTPVVRSFILQLLLQYRRDDAAAHLNEFLRGAQDIVRGENEQDMANLVFMCITVTQDVKRSALSSLCLLDQVAAVQPYLNDLNLLPKETDRFEDFNDMVSIATFRIVTDLYCDVITAVLGGRLQYAQVEEFCNNVKSKQFWDADHSTRLYLCKQLHRSKEGNATFTQARSDDRFRWFMPPGLSGEECLADWGHIACGHNYAAVKNHTVAAVNALQPVEVDKSDANWNSSLFLSCFHADWTLQRPEVSQYLLRSLNHQLAGDPLAEWTNLANQMVKMPEFRSTNSYIPQLIAHVVTVISNQSPLCEITRFFQELLSEPQNCAESFFPSMAENTARIIAAEARAAGLMTTLNVCPKGHPYVIADCGLPVEAGVCNVCGDPIGGRLGPGFQYQAGNKEVAEIYLAQNRPRHFVDGVVAPERLLNLQETVALRAILHSSLLAAAFAHPRDVAQLLSDPDVDPVAHLHALLTTDMTQLAERFRLDVDEAAVMLMLVWAEVHKGTANSFPDPLLKIEDSRGNWERRFVDAFVSPILQDLPAALEEAKRDAIDSDESKLSALIYELVPESPMSRALWGFRHPNTFSSLFDMLSKCLAESERQAELAVIRLFAQHEPMLMPIKYLPSIIRLQMFLSTYMRGIVDPQELTQTTIGNFLEQLVLEDVQFGDTKVQEKLPLDCYSFNGEYLNLPLLFVTPVSVDHGRCGLTLVEYLVDRQNSFVDEYRLLVEPQRRLNDMDIQKCTEAVTISYDRQKDLHPLLLMHRVLELNVNIGRIDTKFDLALLQRRIDCAFLSGAVKFNRQSMSGSRKRDLLGQLPNSLPDVYQLCELADLLIKFSLSFEATESLTALSERLNLRNHPGFIEKLMSSLTIQDLIGLWQVATLKHDILLQLSDGSPTLFRKLGRYELAIEDADKMLLIEAKLDVCDLLCSLTEFLHIHLPRELPALQRLDTELTTYLQMFCNWEGAELPPSICLHHTVDTWKCLEIKFRATQ